MEMYEVLTFTSLMAFMLIFAVAKAKIIWPILSTIVFIVLITATVKLSPPIESIPNSVFYKIYYGKCNPGTEIICNTIKGLFSDNS